MQHRLKNSGAWLIAALYCAVAGAAESPVAEARFMKLAARRFTAADFVQTRKLKELDTELKISGRMLNERDGRLRWQTDAPLRSVTVIDREKLIHFDRETGRSAVITRRDVPWLGVLRECMNDWLCGDRKRLERRFAISCSDDRSLLLVPKEKMLEGFFRAIRLRLTADGAHLERIVMEERGGDTLEIRFLNVVHPPEVPESAWRITE